MSEQKRVILTHGGAGSQNEYSYRAEHAGRVGMKVLDNGKSVLEAVCSAVVELEDDIEFNAGIGSKQRDDGSIQMDASCMDAEGRFGAVAAVEGFRNPIRIAQAVLQTPNILLAGRGAEKFASASGLERWNPDSFKPSQEDVSDTVGAVGFDGKTFAVALSTGGTGGCSPGRVGDVPQFASGLYVGPVGAICATGHGESITRNLTAYRAYQMLELGTAPKIVLKTVLNWFDADTDIGLLIVSRKGSAGGSNRSMAWAEISV